MGRDRAAKEPIFCLPGPATALRCHRIGRVVPGENGKEPVLEIRRQGDLLPPVAPILEVKSDYQAVGLSLKAHPVAFIRSRLDAMGVVRNETLADEAVSGNGRSVSVAGAVVGLPASWTSDKNVRCRAITSSAATEICRPYEPLTCHSSRPLDARGVAH